MIDLRLEQFSGPLDLLLSLIQEKKIEITEISLSEVTEQYLHYVEQLEESRVHELADFLTVASQLLILKAKRLLPEYFPEEEDGPSLEEQLRLYKQFVDVSKQINKCWLSGRRSHFRIEPPRVADTFVPPERCTPDTLRQAMVFLVERLTPLKPLPSVRIDKSVSIKEKIASLREALQRVETFYFHEILHSQKNKTEMIMGFLALLELVKQQTVSLNQQENFGDILIKRT